jgi:hypothetical protein
MISAKQKWPRRLVWLCVVLAGLGLNVFCLMLGLMWLWAARPPAAPPEAANPPTPQVHADRTWAGKSWLGKREGLPVLYLTGTPFEMGYANGFLTQGLIRRQEDSIASLLNRYVRHKPAQFLLKFVVVYKNRHLPEHVTPELQMEILGLTRGCPDFHPEIGPYYQRLLNYHGAQDISYMVMHSPLIQQGCTAIGAWGSTVDGGHLLAGRNFDWEADPVFDQDRLVIFCEPKTGIPFVSLAWGGMAGCVSGLNREGVCITVNGAPSRLPGEAATPTCLVAREVLQHAHTIAEATDIIRKRSVFVSAIFLVGSRRDGRFVVVEKTPEKIAVREPGDATHIACANHYLAPGLAEDPANVEFKRVDTSLPRFERIEELFRDAAGKDGGAPIDARTVAAWLRDRKLPGGAFAGNGHRSALNPLIATHSVIMDLTTGTFWAASPPHQLGKFVAFDVNAPERELPEAAIPADPILASGEYQRFLKAQEQVEAGWRALKRGEPARAAESARMAETNNPGYYRNTWLLAEALANEGQNAEAARLCEVAVARKPALGTERRKIEALARRLNSTRGGNDPGARQE